MMAPDPEGYVKVWRRLLKHPLWKSNNQNAKLLLIHILLTANWKTGQWLYENTLVDIGPGERIGSSIKIAAELSLSRQEFRHAVSTLQHLEILARDATRDKGKRYTRLSLINWDRWQGVDEPEGKPGQPEKGPNSNQTSTRPQPESNQTATTIKEGKEVKKGRREEQATSTPSVSSGKLPEETSVGFALRPTDDNGAKPKTPKKVKSPKSVIMPDWQHKAWCALVKADPKPWYSKGAKEQYRTRVTDESKAAWIARVHSAEVEAGRAAWPGLASWLLGALDRMESDIPVEAALGRTVVNPPDQRKTFEELKQERQHEIFRALVAYDQENRK